MDVPILFHLLMDVPILFQVSKDGFHVVIEFRCMGLPGFSDFINYRIRFHCSPPIYSSGVQITGHSSPKLYHPDNLTTHMWIVDMISREGQIYV